MLLGHGLWTLTIRSEWVLQQPPDPLRRGYRSDRHGSVVDRRRWCEQLPAWHRSVRTKRNPADTVATHCDGLGDKAGRTRCVLGGGHIHGSAAAVDLLLSSGMIAGSQLRS
jgi:hypothetical protein